jgi:hypothetical protein
MAQALKEQRRQADISQLDFEESFALLGERQWLWRENWALAARLHHAPSLKVVASLEDIDYHHPRGLKWVQIDQRRASQWVVKPTLRLSYSRSAAEPSRNGR